MSILSCVLVPNVSFSDFTFGSDIDVEMLPFTCTKVKEADADTPWESYEIDGEDVRFSIENAVLLSFECGKCCMYNGVNLIGVGLKDLVDVLKHSYEIVDRWDGGMEITCDELGLILWIDDDEVESVSVS